MGDGWRARRGRLKRRSVNRSDSLEAPRQENIKVGKDADEEEFNTTDAAIRHDPGISLV